MVNRKHSENKLVADWIQESLLPLSMEWNEAMPPLQQLKYAKPQVCTSDETLSIILGGGRTGRLRIGCKEEYLYLRGTKWHGFWENYMENLHNLHALFPKTQGYQDNEMGWAHTV
jgi:hypothetical protein